MKQIIDLVEAGHRGVLATLVETDGSTPGRRGSRMFILDDGSIRSTIGGGALEHAVRKRAPTVLESGRNVLMEVDLDADLEMKCGGAIKVLLEPILPPDRLIIFGGGHIGMHLCDIGARCGLQVCVLDVRSGFATRKRFPRADQLYDGLDPEKAIETAQITKDNLNSTYVVVVTHDHALDERLVVQLVGLEGLAYLGMIGSSRKASALRKQLAQNGVSRESIALVRSPVGLPLGGRSPGEIAVSIIAEIQMTRKHTRDALRDAL
jgi:xanthine dehydrogenase accessory factor